MSDKKLKAILVVSSVFLCLSLIFCILSVYGSVNQRKYMEGRRIENETEMAKLQMPTFAPKEEQAEDEAEPAVNYEYTEEQTAEAQTKKIVVLDAGHGKSSSAMSADAKTAEGYEYNESRGGWGEWRHYKNGTFGQDCHGSGCTELCPSNASCWYPMGNADRDTEPTINLNNASAAKRYLEQMGYEVRMTRTSDEDNPSMNRRVSYCFPNNDITCAPDASVYVCLHANAGGGRGTSYIGLEGPYRQSLIGGDYIEHSNAMGKLINDKVAAATGLRNNGVINTPYLILFNKCPVPIAYMEIGFYDSDSDLAILKSSSDAIGRAVAEGVDEYIRNSGL